MNQRIIWLSALAFMQLCVIGYVWFSVDTQEQPAAALMTFVAEEIDQIDLDDRTASVRLQRKEAGWTVQRSLSAESGSPDLMADDNKVSALLDKLLGLQAPWPVAATDASLQRFEVAADNYQRRLALRQGDEVVAELLLGTSPGFQRVHARRADSPEIYSVALSNFEVGTNPDDWLAKDLLAVDGDIQRIEAVFKMPQARRDTLVLSDSGWLFNDTPASESAAQSYTERFANLSVLGLAKPHKETDAVEVVADIEVSHGGQASSYTLSRVIPAVDADDSAEAGALPQADPDYLIARRGETQQFRVSTYIAEQLLMTDVDFTEVAAPEPLNLAPAAEQGGS